VPPNGARNGPPRRCPAAPVDPQRTRIRRHSPIVCCQLHCRCRQTIRTFLSVLLCRFVRLCRGTRCRALPQQHMCLMTASSRCRRTIVRPITRTRHGKINTSFLPLEGPCGARPLLRLEDRWKGLADLGRSCGSKTLVPSHYGDDRAEPDQVILAPKVLMVYIWQQDDGRFLQRSCRQRASQREVESLTRSCLLALHLATRAWLRERAPQTLP